MAERTNALKKAVVQESLICINGNSEASDSLNDMIGRYAELTVSEDNHAVVDRTWTATSAALD
jgi:hypothetical protein